MRNIKPPYKPKIVRQDHNTCIVHIIHINTVYALCLYHLMKVWGMPHLSGQFLNLISIEISPGNALCIYWNFSNWALWLKYRHLYNQETFWSPQGSISVQNYPALKWEHLFNQDTSTCPNGVHNCDTEVIIIFSIQKGKKSYNNFDSDFTKERCALSLVDEKIIANLDEELFMGFSFTNPNLLIAS